MERTQVLYRIRVAGRLGAAAGPQHEHPRGADGRRQHYGTGVYYAPGERLAGGGQHSSGLGLLYHGGEVVQEQTVEDRQQRRRLTGGFKLHGGRKGWYARRNRVRLGHTLYRGG